MKNLLKEIAEQAWLATMLLITKRNSALESKDAKSVESGRGGSRSWAHSVHAKDVTKTLWGKRLTYFLRR